MHFHRWEKWQDGTATYNSPLLSRYGVWTGPIQQRRCAKCGKVKIRQVR